MLKLSSRAKKNDGVAKLHSSLWGMSLLAGSMFVTVATAPVAMAADSNGASRDKYLIFFTPGSAEVTPAAQAIVEKAAADASQAASVRVVVRGYAAEREHGAARLAADRAAVVARAMRAQGASQIKAEGAGVSGSAASLLTPEMDRRVEIVVEQHGPAYSSLSPSLQTVSFR